MRCKFSFLSPYHAGRSHPDKPYKSDRLDPSFSFVLIWVTALALLASGLSSMHGAGMPTSLSALQSLGIGKPVLADMVQVPGEYHSDPSTGLAAHVLLANTPQLLLSLLYLLYNDLFTRIQLNAEWLAFSLRSRRRRGLRVTTPIPHTAQRSTRFLQLPLLLSGVLMTASALLHWLTSQSIFLTRIQVFNYQNNGAAPGDAGVAVAGLGWSPYALVLALAVGGGMILGLGTYALLVGGLRPLQRDMPSAGACSVAISAACHVRQGEEGAVTARKPLRWGVVGYDAATGVGHAAFSAEEVEGLVEGRRYAGMKG